MTDREAKTSPFDETVVSFGDGNKRLDLPFQPGSFRLDAPMNTLGIVVGEEEIEVPNLLAISVEEAAQVLEIESARLHGAIGNGSLRVRRLDGCIPISDLMTWVHYNFRREVQS
jgi:hypothetical protein